MLCPKLTGVPSDVDPEEARNAADDFDRFFRSRAIKSDEEGHHASELGFLATDHDWAPPESWAVEHQLQPKLPSKPKVEPQPPTVFESIDHPWPIRIYKPADRFTGESSGRSNSTGGYGSSAYSYLTVLCNPTITAAELCSILQTRFASKMDLTRFRLFVIHGGSERRLLDNDRPLLMLRDWLLEMGYRDYDQFYRILRGDNCCYVARFVFHEYPPAPPVSSRYEVTLNTAHSISWMSLNRSSLSQADRRLPRLQHSWLARTFQSCLSPYS